MLFRAMPITMALFIGRRLGGLSRFFNKKRGRIAYANLKAALGPRYTPAQLAAILRRTYANIGQGIVEVMILPKLGERYLRKYITFEDFHLADDALKTGKGLIFLTGHFGNWEIANVALPLKGFTYKAIARQQKPYLINELLNTYRQSKGCKIISKGPGVKEVLRALHANGIVGMLVDQDAGKDGVFVELFGRDASWHRGVFEFALKTGATVMPGFALRQKGPRIVFKVFEPIRLSQHGQKEDIIKDAFRQHIAALEAMIEKAPEQWLWQHKRWKSTPVRNVLILNDKRIGHLRQSEAVLRKIRQIWVRRGYRSQDIRSKVIDIDIKNRLCRGLLSLTNNLSGRYCQGCLGCLRTCLSAGSYKDVVGEYADIVISCGSSTAGVNFILAKENNARSVVIMKPANMGIKKFDLAIIPAHDKPPRGKNIVITEGALNLIDKEYMRANAQEILKATGPLRKKVIGVLIGGSTKDFSMRADCVDMVLKGLLDAADEFDCDILLTTSRRTPEDIEGLIRDRLKGSNRCKLLLIANEKNIEGAVEGILELSHIALVSQESISMVSEAASSTAYTLVFNQGTDRNIRHRDFLSGLKGNGHIEISDCSDIHRAIAGIFTKGPEMRILDDMSKIEGPLERLL